MIGALHRQAYRIAHRIRHRWRRWRGTPIEGVAIIARDLNGQVLLVRHSYGPQGWYFPSGGIKRGETRVDAAIRELREETGCEALGIQPIGRIEEELSGSPHTSHVFTATTHDTPRPDRREIVEARFFPTHSLPEPLSPRTRARLELWQKPREDPGFRKA